MRFLSALSNDIRYQFRYGIHFLYLFFTALYTALLFLCPKPYQKAAASLIVLTDPAMLGSFFVGGIYLLEKGEGLHGYLSISPLRTGEYLLSKAASLALISTATSVLILFIALPGQTDYILLMGGVLISSMVFTLIGLTVASQARSVNHYMLLLAPFEIFATVPPVLSVFGITHPLFLVSPGMAAWRLIGCSIGHSHALVLLSLGVLLLWLAAAFILANQFVPRAIGQSGEGA